MKKNYAFLNNTLFGAMFFSLSLLSGHSISAQIVNFTIDTAVDHGTNITETIIVGSDTYVMTIDHVQNVEELFDLGAGDFAFYLGSGNASEPFTVTITKNGTATNFDLTSIGYDTVRAGTISVTNQDDAFISSPKSYAIGAGSLTMNNPSNGLNINVIKIIPANSTDLNFFVFHNISVNVSPTLGLEENVLLGNNVSIFPNPSNGNIEISTSIALEKAVVADLNGRTVIAYNLNGIIGNQNLKMNSVLSQGVYFMTIFSGKNTVTKKLIIK